MVGVVLARDPNSSVFGIVSFAWAGFGGSFGAVVLCSLFWKRCNWQGALAGMLSGGLMVFVWKYIISPLGGVFGIYELLPAFLISLVVCVVVSLVTPVASGVDPSHVLLAAAVAALAACAAGLVAVVITGRWWLIALGATCLVAAWGYTNGRHPYGYRGLGELAAFVFFGLVPALGTQYALSGSITVTGVAGSVICGLLSVSVMMVNNLRDLEDDAAHGKRTLMVRIGSGKGKCWCMRALGWAAGLTVVFAMPLSVYAKLLDLLIKLPAEVDRDRSCTEYGICGDWSWGNADWMSLAAFVSIAGCVAIATRAVAAVRHDQWRRALPLCSMTSLVAAGAFVLNACQAGFMA